MIGIAKKTGAAAIFATALACGSAEQSPQSQLEVTNGVKIDEDKFPATVLISGEVEEGSWICTGTFVNDYQMVSAGHCVDGLRAENPNLFVVGFNRTSSGSLPFKKAKATSLVRHESYRMNGSDGGVNGFDISVITFPRNTSQYWAPIAQQAPEIDSQIVIVGYGNNRNYIDGRGNLSGSGSGTKRIGVNIVGALFDGLILFAGLTEADGETPQGYLASSGSGDSGGPMFHEGELVGITSGGGLGRNPSDPSTPVAISKYVDINSPSSQAFLSAHLNL